MKSPLYREAISHSWKLAWSHKLLWPLGLFAAFLGQMGMFEILSTVKFAGADFVTEPYPARVFLHIAEVTGSGEAVAPFGMEQWSWFFLLLAVLLGMAILLIYISVTSQGALIHATAVSTKKKALPDLTTSWHKSTKHFWRLFGIQVVKRIFFVGIASFVLWSSLNGAYESSVGDIFLFFTVFVVASIVGLVVSFLSVYAAGYVVIEEYGFIHSIRAAWRLFTEHWLVSIEVGFLVLFYNILLTLATFLGLILIFLPTLLLWVVAALLANSVLFVVGMVVGVAVFTLYMMFLGSVFTVFTTSVWTYVFMKMHRHGVSSRILHFLGVQR